MTKLNNISYDCIFKCITKKEKSYYSPPKFNYFFYSIILLNYLSINSNYKALSLPQGKSAGLDKIWLIQ